MVADLTTAAFAANASGVFDNYAETITLDGQTTRAIVERDAEVIIGEIMDQRVTAEFLLSENDPAKGTQVIIDEIEYSLEVKQRRDLNTVVWALRRMPT